MFFIYYFVVIITLYKQHNCSLKKNVICFCKVVILFKLKMKLFFVFEDASHLQHYKCSFLDELLF